MTSPAILYLGPRMYIRVKRIDDAGVLVTDGCAHFIFADNLARLWLGFEHGLGPTWCCFVRGAPFGCPLIPAAVEDVNRRYDIHRRAARDIAAEYFDSARTLARLIELAVK